MSSRLTRPHAARAARCAALATSCLAIAGCASEPEPIPEPTFTPRGEADTAAEAIQPTDAPEAIQTTGASQPTDAPGAGERRASASSAATADGALVERSAMDFNIGEYDKFDIAFAPDANCSNFEHDYGNLYIDCHFTLAGDIPPADIDNANGAAPDAIMWVEGKGFRLTQDVGGADRAVQNHPLNKGEFVRTGGTTYTHKSDGTIRVEREGQWFEISPQGQYSSDRFTPHA